MARTLGISTLVRSRKVRRIVGMTALGLLLAGCVSQDKYNALKLDRDGLAEQLTKAQTDLASASAASDSYKSQLQQLMNNGGSLQALVTNQSTQIATLQQQLDDLNKRYSEAMNRPLGAPALPPALSNALSEFAAAHPDIVDFDSARGVVKFKSDVTFAVGDAELTPKAREAIDSFATILNSPAASGYELIVAGHTDNQRVVNEATIRKGHKDNWYLSAHRAISVADDLIGERVNPQRIAVTGYADQRPIASNSSESGRAQNRRVEVLILPTMVHAPALAKETAPAHTRSVVRAPSMNKDSAETAAPEMNK